MSRKREKVSVHLRESKEDLLFPLKKQLEILSFGRELLLQGKPKREIKELFKKYYSLNETQQESFYLKLTLFFRNIVFDNETLLEDTVNLHVLVYEKAYEFFNDIDNIPGKLKALLQKEKISGLHQESNSIEIFQQNNLTINNDEEEYKISQLTEPQQQRLKALLDKTL